ncbi:glycoside hydrolase family 27 protein [Calycina marina]|uniref:Alpha-galactosidase n=1 Tax=Calycina marina TaxID=1763456 RepID=A0A9P7Z8J4_9HELO|nr:glycoside hydrolase family 27 protein [Calycina marina]
MAILGLLSLLVAASSALSALLSKPPSVLQPTPPMGYNNWAHVMCGLNESLFVETAQAMARNGLLAAGYNRINLDDCWSNFDRASNGSMAWNAEKFPRGLSWLTNYLNSLGFIAGIYTDAGILSCGGFPGAYDGCNMRTGTEAEYKAVYGRWHDVLSEQNPPMVFSESAPAYFAEAANLTDWYSVMGWVREYGQLARHSRDSLVWNSTLYWPDITGWDSIMFNYGQEVRLARYQKPGYFNDPYFLNVDHFDYTLNEKKSQFALWSSLSAPLILSTSVPRLTPDELAYLTNKDIIAINQDILALQATLVSQSDTWDVLTKSLANGDRLLTILNRGNFTGSHIVSFDQIGLPTASKVSVKDLWTGETISVKHAVLAKSIESHATAIFRLSGFGGAKVVIATGKIFNTYSLNTLTFSGKNLHWSTSTGDVSQVWQAKGDGTVRNLAYPAQCLTSTGLGKQVGIKGCSGCSAQKWGYYISGNLMSKSSRGCLTEAASGVVTVSGCLYEDNTQVVALPGGVEVIGN